VRTTDVPGITGIVRRAKITYLARNVTLFGTGEVAQLRGSALHTIATGLPRAGRVGISAD